MVPAKLRAYFLASLVLGTVVPFAQSQQPKDLDDIVAILTSPEPQYRGVSDLINGSGSYFGVVWELARRRSVKQYDEYSILDKWAAEQIEKNRALVERGEAYRSTYFAQSFRPVHRDPRVEDISRKYRSILAMLRGDPANSTEPPLHTHNEAVVASRDALRPTATALDRDYYPDAYSREVNQGAFRRMEQPNYARLAKLDFHARIHRIKQRLEEMQIGAFRDYLKVRASTTGLFAGPNVNLDDQYDVDRDKITRVEARKVDSLPLKMSVNQWGDSVFYYEEVGRGGRKIRKVFGLSEGESWHPYSTIGRSRGTLMGEEKSMGIMEEKFLTGQVPIDELALGVVKKFQHLAAGLRQHLEKVKNPKDLTKLWRLHEGALGSFIQRPDRQGFFWPNAGGLGEYRNQTQHYNRLMSGIVWAGRAEDVEHGTNYWERRDLQAALSGRPDVREALKGVRINRGGLGLKGQALQSLGYLKELWANFRGSPTAKDLSHAFETPPLGNTPESKNKLQKKLALYVLERETSAAKADHFLKPRRARLDALPGEHVSAKDLEDGRRIRAQSQVRATPQDGRLYLVIPRNYVAVDGEVLKANGSLLSRDAWDLKVDPSSGHHWIQLKDAKESDSAFLTKVSFVPKVGTAPSPEVMDQLLIRDPARFQSLIDEMRIAGFTVTADALEHLADVAQAEYRHLTVEEVQDVFTMTSQNTYQPERDRSAAAASKTQNFELSDFKRFLNDDGVLCGQCDSGNEHFATFMRSYFSANPRVAVETEGLFKVKSTSNVLTEADGHRVTHFKVDGILAKVADATPDNETMERLEALKRKIAYQSEKSEALEKKEAQKAALDEPVPKKKEIHDAKVEELRRYHSELESSRQSLLGRVSGSDGRMLPAYRARLTPNEPLGRALFYTQRLESFLEAPPTPERVAEFANAVGLPEGQTLNSVLRYIGVQTELKILPVLEQFEKPGRIQKSLLRRSPALEGSLIRRDIKQLSEHLMRAANVVDETVVGRYALSGRMVQRNLGPCRQNFADIADDL